MERVALASPGVDGVARDSGLSDPRLCNTLILKRWVINKNHVKGFLMKQEYISAHMQNIN
jgi:hypothetical protein